MAIILPGGFNITNNEPVDSRLSVADASARLGLSFANVYEGLIVYQKDTNEIYVLIDSSDPSSSGNWSLLPKISGSNLFIGDQTVTGNIRATGDIIAERYIVSSSIVNITQSFSSGSTIFGDTLDDTHQFTGSVSITGSFFLNNTDILAEIQSSGIFRQTGSYYSTTNDLKVTGSFQINLDGNQDQFSVDITGSTKFQINEQGVVILGAFEYTPSPVAGGMFYSQSNEFFLGL